MNQPRQPRPRPFAPFPKQAAAYVIAPFAEHKYERVNITGYYKFSTVPSQMLYWVVTERGKRDLFFHDELQRLTPDRQPCGLSFSQLMDALRSPSAPRPELSQLSFNMIVRMLGEGLLPPEKWDWGRGGRKGEK